MRSNQDEGRPRKPLAAAMRTDLRSYRTTGPMVVVIKKKKAAKRSNVASGRKA